MMEPQLVNQLAFFVSIIKFCSCFYTQNFKSVPKYRSNIPIIYFFIFLPSSILDK